MGRGVEAEFKSERGFLSAQGSTAGCNELPLLIHVQIRDQRFVHNSGENSKSYSCD